MAWKLLLEYGTKGLPRFLFMDDSWHHYSLVQSRNQFYLWVRLKMFFGSYRFIDSVQGSNKVHFESWWPDKFHHDGCNQVILRTIALTAKLNEVLVISLWIWCRKPHYDMRQRTRGDWEVAVRTTYWHGEVFSDGRPTARSMKVWNRVLNKEGDLPLMLPCTQAWAFTLYSLSAATLSAAQLSFSSLITSYY